VEIYCLRSANFSQFNTLLRFAQFVCNIISSHQPFFYEISRRGAKMNFWWVVGAERVQNFFLVFRKLLILNDRSKSFFSTTSAAFRDAP
jgi:hypothetical protein